MVPLTAVAAGQAAAAHHRLPPTRSDSSILVAAAPQPPPAPAAPLAAAAVEAVLRAGTVAALVGHRAVAAEVLAAMICLVKEEKTRGEAQLPPPAEAVAVEAPPLQRKLGRTFCGALRSLAAAQRRTFTSGAAWRAKVASVGEGAAAAVVE